MRVRNICGGLAKEADFLFREKELAAAELALKDGNSLKLFSLRRIGKSSFLIALRDRLHNNGIPITFINLEGKEAPSDFFHSILDHLPKDISDKLIAGWGESKTIPHQLVESLKKRSKKIRLAKVGIDFEQSVLDYWNPLADAVGSILEKTENPGVIIFDEIPFFLENMIERGHGRDSIESVMGALRQFRQQGLSMILCGSIGMDALLERHNIDPNVINDLKTFHLAPLSHEQAREMLTVLADSQGLDWWNEETTDAVLANVRDWLPYFLQFAFLEVHLGGKGDPETVSEIYRAKIFPGLIQDFITQFENRLKRRYDPPERAQVDLAFNAILKSETRALPSADLRTLLAPTAKEPRWFIKRLIDDGFLTPPDAVGNIGFTLRFLEEWWERS
jgi:hypothetical protein